MIKNFSGFHTATLPAPPPPPFATEKSDEKKDIPATFFYVPLTSLAAKYKAADGRGGPFLEMGRRNIHRKKTL